MRDFLAICLRIFSRSVGSDDAGDRFADGLSVGREIIGRTPCVETVAEIFVVLRE